LEHILARFTLIPLWREPTASQRLQSDTDIAMNTAFELWVILNTDIEFIFRNLNSLYKQAIRRCACEDHTIFFKYITIFIVEFIAMSVSLCNLWLAVGS